MARSGGPGAKSISAILVPHDAVGLSLGANEYKMGWNAQPTRSVRFDGVRLGADALLATEGKGFNIAMAGLNGGRINIAACSLGGASAALAQTVTCMAKHKAFGQRLSQMLALQFKLAAMSIDLEAARTFLWRAAAALDAKSPDATVLCAAAKKFVTDVGFNIANDPLKRHGSYGCLAGYGIERSCGIFGCIRSLRARMRSCA